VDEWKKPGVAEETSGESASSPKEIVGSELRGGRRRQLGGSAQTRVDVVAANEGEHIEQTRAYRFARSCYTGGVDHSSRLHTTRLGRRAHRGFDRRRLERGQRGQRRIERQQMLAHPGHTHVLGERRFVVLDRAREEQAPLLDEVAQAARAA